MRSTTQTVICDVDKTTSATVDDDTSLPQGWMDLVGRLFGSSKNFNQSEVDVCPTCLAQLSALPAQWQAIIPATPS